MSDQKGRRSHTWLRTWLPALMLALAFPAYANGVPLSALPQAAASAVPSVSVVSPTPRTSQDPALLAKAWAMPVALQYRPHIEFQQNLSFCGPASLANVAHSMGQSLNQSAVLDGTGVNTMAGYLPAGITLDTLADVARVRFAGARVTVLRGLDLPTFRQHLRRVNEPGRRYVVNFSRVPLFGAGGGHHSPVVAYLEQEDLVLVLDVNRAFGPWLVKSEDLLAAMNTRDDTAQAMRGLLLLER